MAIKELQNGRYTLVRRLGSGGMGEVYLMQDERISRQVAIKVLRVEESETLIESKSAGAARLFEREARAIAAMDHPNILPLYDFGEEVTDEGSMAYMVMPYCADGSLETWLRQQGRGLLPPPRVALLIEQAAEGLQYAHDHQIIHLDVKPPNFLMRVNRKDLLQPTLLLADFGISRNFTTISSASHTIRGTPAAMAPEQWSGLTVFASDQYALAVMAHEMLVGRPPFIGSMEQLMYRHLSVQPQPPSVFNPRLPLAVDAVLLRALSKRPQDRYPTISEFASALTAAASQPTPYAEADLAGYSTLTISSSEAEAGLSRLLTLVDGEEITVTVPPGAQHGQFLRLPRAEGGSDDAEMVLVNIAIQNPETPSVRGEPGATPNVHLAETPSIIGGDSEQLSPETPQAVLPASSRLRDGEQSRPAPRVSEAAPLRLASATPATSLEHDLPTIASSRKEELITVTPPSLASPRRRFGVIALISVLVILLLLASGSFVVIHQFVLNQNQPTPIPTHMVQATVTAKPTAAPPGKYIAGHYNGSMAANDGSQSASITVSIVQTQGSSLLSGAVTFNSATSSTLKGTDDLQGHFSFSVEQPAGQLPLVFYGSYTTDTNLHGFYCRSNTGSCLADSGYFTVGPQY